MACSSVVRQSFLILQPYHMYQARTRCLGAERWSSPAPPNLNITSGSLVQTVERRQVERLVRLPLDLGMLASVDKDLFIQPLRYPKIMLEECVKTWADFGYEATSFGGQ